MVQVHVSFSDRGGLFNSVLPWAGQVNMELKIRDICRFLLYKRAVGALCSGAVKKIPSCFHK